MTVYDTRQRCPYCRRYDLPCNEAVHGNPLYPYLSAVSNAVPIVPGLAEPTIRMATPPPATPSRLRERSISFALALVLVAAVAAIAASAVAVLGTGNHPCSTPPCAPVQYATVGTAPPTLPR